jgi:DNA-binding HxlR family transcriptional regulator
MKPTARRGAPNPLRRRDLGEAECPVARSLDSIGDWWSLLIMRDAVIFDKRRFGEFQKSLGLARNILTTRLRKLVSHGVLELVPASDGSAYRKYVPTERGQALYVVLTALRQRGEASFKPRTLSTVLADSRHGEPARPLELRGRDGRLLGPGEIRVVPVTEARFAKETGRKRRTLTP